MAIRRQNRTIWVLALVIFLMLVIFLKREGKLQNLFGPMTQEGSSEGGTSLTAEFFGDKVETFGKAEGLKQEEKQLKFADVLGRLGQCFQYPSKSSAQPVPVQIESLVQKVQIEAGPVTQQADRWVNWTLKTREGHERRLQLQITENDEGQIGRELHYFNVNHDGQLSPIEIDAQMENQPTDDVINDMLKDGEVVFKERSAVIFFSNGDRVEYIEKNNELSEIEMFRTDRQFRCSDILLPDSCQCQ